MIVGVCHTKVPHVLYDAFIEGIKKHGDTHYDIVEHHPEWRKVLRMCDVSMQICEGHLRSEDGGVVGNAFRSKIREQQIKNKKRRLVFETGFIKNDATSGESYFQVGYDGMKRSSVFYGENSPKDRWGYLGIKEKPWRTRGSHILIMEQNKLGPGSSHIDIVKWWKQCVNKIRDISDRPIKVRPHPRCIPSFPKNLGVEVLQKGNPIEQDLKDCWCSVVRTSNSAVDSIINGIPVITPDEMCMSYDVSSHSIEDINDPVTPNRTQWLYNLAYSQWSLDEIRKGIPWGRLREFASD